MYYRHKERGIIVKAMQYDGGSMTPILKFTDPTTNRFNLRKGDWVTIGKKHKIDVFDEKGFEREFEKIGRKNNM